MISCIVCSCSKDNLSALKESIANTIGVEYEFVIIDNTDNKYSIFSAYNEGIRQAKGEFLCFMHEDVKFYTNNWGGILTTLFNTKDIGLIGLFGSHVVNNHATPWIHTMHTVGHMIQGRTEKGHYHADISNGANFYAMNNHILEVACVDGFFFSIPKKVCDIVTFDEHYYDRIFHAYDLDICMQIVVSGYKVCVTDAILAEHFSSGNYSKSWEKAMNKFTQKWKQYLPIIKIPQPSEKQILSYVQAYEDLSYESYLLTQRVRHIRNCSLYKFAAWFMRLSKQK